MLFLFFSIFFIALKVREEKHVLLTIIMNIKYSHNKCNNYSIIFIVFYNTVNQL